MDNLEDYWDKPRTITARQLATALMDVDLTRVESRETMYLDLAAAIIAAIPETAKRCHPRGHRYDRIGTTDRLRCRRCGWERAG